MSPAPDRLFVYGTLRRGFRNHAAHTADATEVVPGEATGELYALWSFPALVLAGSGRVRGELLRFPDLEAKLRALDAFEGVGGPPWPQGPGFERAVTTVRRLDTGAREDAWCYVHPVERREALLRWGAVRIASGDWAEHAAGAGRAPSE